MARRKFVRTIVRELGPDWFGVESNTVAIKREIALVEALCDLDRLLRDEVRDEQLEQGLGRQDP